mmetsp:Transcript_53209/g.129211  ORF Transcript_53209/g.129211 Transcript_53209/m.129211 type:complete len:569 (+) Transcript_53209:479-2185(+)
MVHVCKNVQEIVDPSTRTVDTLCIIGTLKSFQSDFIINDDGGGSGGGWVMNEILPIALSNNSSPTSSGETTDPPALKKPKTSAATAAVEQARYLLTSVLENLLATITPSKDTPTSTEVWVPRSSYMMARGADAQYASSSSQSPLLVVLIVLPSTSTLSRHNCLGQAASITSMLKKHVRLTESTVVVPLLERPEDARSVVCAIARVSGALLYNRKTRSSSSSSSGAVGGQLETTATTGSPTGGGSSSNRTPVQNRAVLRQPGPLVLPAGPGGEKGGGTSGRGGTFIHETALPSLNHLRVMLGHPTRVIPMTDTLQEELATLALGIQLTRRLVDAPCSELTTTAFKEQALAICQDLTYALQANGAGTVTTKVIEGEDLDKQGFGGLYGVGKAAVHPPALVILSYTPSSVVDSGKTPSIVLVGKGIVFDTGGLQIKNKPGMLGMKRDMGGAAAILSSFGAAVRSQKPLRRPLHAVLCLAENAVATHATRADDILHMYSGKTVEINNTDAEGRLVLSDGCSAAIRHLNPGVIIDMATLTGAQGVATGKYFGALYCNDEKLEDIAIESGRLSG